MTKRDRERGKYARVLKINKGSHMSFTSWRDAHESMDVNKDSLISPALQILNVYFAFWRKADINDAGFCHVSPVCCSRYQALITSERCECKKIGSPIEPGNLVLQGYAKKCVSVSINLCPWSNPVQVDILKVLCDMIKMPSWRMKAVISIF